MSKTSLQAVPYMQKAENGSFQSLGVQISIKADSKQTGGDFNLFELLLPIGYETQLHIHYAEDVAIHVLEGELDIFWGEERMHAGEGAFFYQPRGTPHGFRAMGTKPVRITYLTIPAGFDGFVIEHSRPISESEDMLSQAKFKIEVLGSLSE
jgi:mannose-6-phosphate isomerase-like protein (cupin superfamily)